MRFGMIPSVGVCSVCSAAANGKRWHARSSGVSPRQNELERRKEAKYGSMREIEHASKTDMLFVDVQ